MRKFILLMILFGLAVAVAHGRRWQNLHVGHREYQTISATEAVIVVYSVTADLTPAGVVFDLDIDHRTPRVSRSVADVRVAKGELAAFENVLKTFDQWRDQARETRAAAFEKSLGQAAEIEWWFAWSGKEAQLRSGVGRRRHPLALAEPDVTVFRVLLVSAPDMEKEIRGFRRE